MSRIIDGLRDFGAARWIIVAMLAGIWIIAALWTDVDLSRLASDCLVRGGMNGVLVLALLLPVRAGNGLNFGLPLGIVCGLVGGVVAVEFGAEHPFGVFDNAGGLSRGWGGFWFAHLVALPLAALAGWAYGWLLERVRGQEMMVGVYVGFGAIALMCVVWLIVPTTSSELLLTIGGHGVRNQVVLDGYFTRILDDWHGVPSDTLKDRLGQFSHTLEYCLDYFSHTLQTWFGEHFRLPLGLLAYWIGACLMVAFFLRTRLGQAMNAAGANPAYATSIGVRVRRVRIASTVASTMLAAAGILVYSQSYGWLQLYKGPLWMGFQAVAALLLGGASMRHATIAHVIVGTLLFQSLLTSSLPVVSSLVAGSSGGAPLAMLPEIARMIIQNGVILYALSRVRGGRS